MPEAGCMFEKKKIAQSKAILLFYGEVIQMAGKAMLVFMFVNLNQTSIC